MTDLGRDTEHPDSLIAQLPPTQEKWSPATLTMNIFMGVSSPAGARHSANISAMIDLSNLSSRWRVIISSYGDCFVFICLNQRDASSFSAWITHL